jgi:hypothetical protein
MVELLGTMEGISFNQQSVYDRSYEGEFAMAPQLGNAVAIRIA